MSSILTCRSVMRTEVDGVLIVHGDAARGALPPAFESYVATLSRYSLLLDCTRTASSNSQSVTRSRILVRDHQPQPFGRLQRLHAAAWIRGRVRDEAVKGTLAALNATKAGAGGPIAMTEREPDSMDGSEPAMPGPYGRAPRGYRLPEGTRLGRPPSRLPISIAHSRSIKRRSVCRCSGAKARVRRLARKTVTRPLVMLHEHADAREAPHRSHSGLFHFAILLPRTGHHSVVS